MTNEQFEALTPVQQRAIQWLYERNGSGVIDRFGYIVAGGDRSKSDPATWLRLVSLGHMFGGGARLYVSPTVTDFFAANKGHPAFPSHHPNRGGIDVVS